MIKKGIFLHSLVFACTLLAGDKDETELGHRSVTFVNYRSFDVSGGAQQNHGDDVPLLNDSKETSFHQDQTFTPDLGRVDQEESNDTSLFFTWFDQSIINPSFPTRLLQTTGYIGLGIGGFAAYSSFPLAADFGQLLVGWMGITRTSAQDFGYYLFGVDAAIPSMALNAVATRQQFQEFLTLSHNDLSELGKDKLFKASKIAAHVLGIFSAMSSGYVGFMVSKDFPTPITILLTSTAYIGCYMFTVESEKRLLRAIFNYFKQKQSFFRHKLQYALLNSMKIISCMEEREFDEHYQLIFRSLSEDESYSHIQRSLEKFQHILKMGERATANTLPQSKWNYFGKKATEIIGSIIGAAETYVAFKLVEEATLYLCDQWGIEDEETRRYMSNSFASLACIPWGSLDIEGVKGRFVRMYNALFNQTLSYQREFVNPRVSTTIKILSTWGGCSAAVPATYLAIQTTEGFPLGVRILLSTATFLCPATVLTEALETMLDHFWSWIKSFREDSLALHKEKLVRAIEKTSSKIGELSDEAVYQLYLKVFNEEENLGSQET